MDVARDARDWSWQNIYDRLGILPPEVKNYRPAKLQKSAADTRKQYLKNYLEHRAYGWDNTEAFQDRTRKTFENKLAKKGDGGDVGTLVRRWEESNRRDDWRHWSSSKALRRFPGWIKEYARYYNRLAHQNKNSRFGYAAMYYRYVEGWDEDDVFDYISPQDSPIGYVRDMPWSDWR